MKLIFKVRTSGDDIQSATFRDDTGKEYRWVLRTDEVCQWIQHPVASHIGYGDGYWRRAGRRISAQVRGLVENLHKQNRSPAPVAQVAIPSRGRVETQKAI